MKTIYFLFVTTCITLTSTAQTYFVKQITPGAVQVDGKGDSKGWLQANVLTTFVYPWDSVAAPATSFSALWDGECIYCLFRVKDDDFRVNSNFGCI